MALKGDMQPVVDAVELGFFFDSTAERGGIASISTTGSGINLDSSLNVAQYHTTGSGALPLGMLQQDVVNKDLTQTHLDFHKDEVQVGGKVTLYRQGWFTTDRIIGTPTAGAAAYLAATGHVSPTRTNTGWPQVGSFITPKDSNGYARVWVNV